MSRECRSGVHMRESLSVHTFVLVALLVCIGGPSAGYADASDVVPDPPDTTAPEIKAALPDSTEPEESRAPLPDRVVVYYFHRTLRCDTCLKFEAYTGEALGAAFAGELGDGTLEWHVVNLDNPGNEHFVDDYYITESSVVAIEFRGGEQKGWTNLDAIWGCVGNKPTFLSYIQSEVTTRLVGVLQPEPTHGSVRDSVTQPGEDPIRR